jgi:hypothetical protein
VRKSQHDRRVSDCLAAQLGIDDQFVEGHEPPANVAKKVPERMVGRLLPADEARELLEAMEG